MNSPNTTCKTKTLLFLPGLATKGRSKEIFLKSSEEIEKRGIPLELKFLDYPSHATQTITGFERDVERLDIEVKTLAEKGTKEIGLFGVCYGAYVASRYLSQNPKSPVAFSIFVEPYFGIKDIHPVYASLAQTIILLPKAIGRNIQLPVTNKGKVTKTIDLYSLAKFVNSQFSPIKSTPSLAFMTNYHHFFNRESIESQLRNANTEIAQISQEAIVSRNPIPFVEIIEPFLRKL
ncbi:MAG: hypothetical protein AABX11_05705 [Nanoarchaeota archaeon]